MIHLMTVEGGSARKFYLDKESISDFKALLRTITSGRVMIVSTWFRSDLFYASDRSLHTEIQKMWVLYTKSNRSEFNEEDLKTISGDENALCYYFESINKLASNWQYFNQYRQVFNRSFINDRNNPMINTIAQCDRHLVDQPKINRSGLLDSNITINKEIISDTFDLAMKIINCDTHAN